MFGPKTTVRVVRGARDQRAFRRMTIGTQRVVPKPGSASPGSSTRMAVLAGPEPLESGQVGTFNLQGQQEGEEFKPATGSVQALNDSGLTYHVGARLLYWIHEVDGAADLVAFPARVSRCDLEGTDNP